MSRSFRSLADLGAFLANRVATLPHAEHEALDKASEHFLAEVKKIPGTYQDGWPQLAESTQADRVAKGFTPNDPLKRTGAFAETFERRVLGDHHAAIGTNDERGPWFENGTAKMPPRPVLGAAIVKHGQETADIVGKHIAQHLAGRE